VRQPHAAGRGRHEGKRRQSGPDGVTAQLQWHVESIVPAAVQLGQQGVELLADARDLASELFGRGPRAGVVRSGVRIGP
jgi:hypothetical protein